MSFISNEAIESSVDSDPKSDVDSDLDERGESGVCGVIKIKSELSWRPPEVLLTSTSELCSSQYLFCASETSCANSVICSSKGVFLTVEASQMVVERNINLFFFTLNIELV